MQSPLCELMFDPFLSSPPCLLHLEPLGLVKNHLQMTIKLLSDVQLVQLTSLLADVGLKLEFLSTWRGTESLLFCEHASVFFHIVGNTQVSEVWEMHLKSLSLLYSPVLRQEDIEELVRLCRAWRDGAFGLYGEGDPTWKAGGPNWHTPDHWLHHIIS